MVPDFELRAASGALVSLQDLLDRGPAVITFTLGAASPRCRRALLALQAALPDLSRHGATLIAITPDPPDVSRNLAAGGGLTFDLFSDEGGHLAALFGIAYRPPVEMAAWLARLALAPAAVWRSAELPLTAAYVVTGDGIAAWTFVDADPLARVEPRQIIEALAGLPAQAASGTT
jgi:peroxiredoxin